PCRGGDGEGRLVDEPPAPPRAFCLDAVECGLLDRVPGELELRVSALELALARIHGDLPRLDSRLARIDGGPGVEQPLLDGELNLLVPLEDLLARLQRG